MKIQGPELLGAPQSALLLRDGFTLLCTGVSVVTGVKKQTQVTWLSFLSIAGLYQVCSEDTYWCFSQSTS